MARWELTWVRAMADVRAFETSFEDVTVRARTTAASAGPRLRVELSNAFGDVPLVIGRGVVTVGELAAPMTFDGFGSVSIPAGRTRWTDPIGLAVGRGDQIVVDLYLPDPTPHATGNFARTAVEVSAPGDHAGVLDFSARATPTIPAPDGSEMAIPVPFLRAVDVEVDGGADKVVACLGDSITAGGWPEMAAELFRDEAHVVMLNLGIAGNRLRIDPAPEIASFGRSGLSRFEEDVLAASGVSDVVIALGTNDLGLPGSTAPSDELPAPSQLIDAYTQLIDRATAAGIRPIVATITPFMGAEGYDAGRDRTRAEVNAWIRESAPRSVDFDTAVRSRTTPTQLADEYDSGDHLHPNEAGEAELARAIADVLSDVRSTDD